MHIRGGKGGGGVIEKDPFLKIGKIPLISEKNALVVFVYGLNVSFEMQFQEKLGEQTSKFFPVQSFFGVLQIKCSLKCPHSKNPCLLGKILGCAPQKSFTKAKRNCMVCISMSLSAS